jgi:hypothetical protein
MAAPPLLPLPPAPLEPWRPRATDRRVVAASIAVTALALPLAIGPAAPNPLLLVAGAALAGYHFARLAAQPRVDPLTAALPMSLAGAALLPAAAAAALIVPLAVALILARSGRLTRIVALLVQCGVLAALAAAAGSIVAAAAAPSFFLVLSMITAGKELSDAANDNPSMERVKRFPEDSKLPHSACYASSESIPGKWGVS